VRAAVEETGRRKLIVAGLVTEVCVAQSVLAARKEGFDVYFVSDCCGGTTKEAHEDGKVRMTMAGAVPINWMSVGAEWAPYWASPGVAAVSSAWTGTAGLARDYAFAQLTAGVVQLPDSLSHLASAGTTG
jgi:Isochorismatase family